MKTYHDLIADFEKSQKEFELLQKEYQERKKLYDQFMSDSMRNRECILRKTRK